jgi:biopolymer transport protein ExbD
MPTFSKSRALKAILEDEDWSLPTSFIDVVFLLLLFFMISSRFKTLEQRLEALLPKDKGFQQIQQQITRNLDEIVIHVTADKATLQTPIFKIHDRETHKVHELAALLSRIKETSSNKADIPPVVIAGKPDCPFKHIMAALDACAMNKLTKVEFRPPTAGPEAGGSDSDHAPL